MKEAKDSSAKVKTAKQAPKKLPQTEVRGKGARPKIPQKQGWILLTSTVALLAWVALSTIAAQLIVGYIMLWMVGAEKFEEPAFVAVYSAVSYLLTLALVIFVPPQVAKLMKQRMGEKDAKAEMMDREQLGLCGWPSWTDILLSPVAYVVYLILATAVMAVFSSFSWFDAEQVQDVGYSVMMSGGERALAFIMLVVVAPVAEEIIFRGWLYGKLRQKFAVFKNKWAGMILAIFLVSVLFGALHMQWNVGVNVFALSIVLCVLREITGTIYSGILLHMIKNGLAFYLLYVAGV